jgi:hypothetical protein
MAVIHLKHHRKRLPSAPEACLRKLADHAEHGEVTGVAFICLMDDGHGFIADTCGIEGHRQHATIRQLLKALDAKIAKRQLKHR